MQSLARTATALVRRHPAVLLVALAAALPALAPLAAQGARARIAQRPPTAPRFSTFAGRSQWDEDYDVALDARGNTYVAGFTFSPEFPHVGRGPGRFRGVQDATVQRYDSNGRLVYSTILGGIRVDVAQSIAVDRRGNAYVTGRTLSPDFPTRRAAQRHIRGDNCQGNACPDAFITKLDPRGRIVYSTFLGGSVNEEGWGIAVDRAGSAYVVGNTDSGNLPTRRAFQRRNRSKGCAADVPCPPEVFVTKLAPSGRSIAYSTYLGGRMADTAGGIAVDARGSAYVTGSTRSSNFPVRRAFQRRINGRACGVPPGVPCTDAFLVKLAASGRSMSYGTYLGGTGNDHATDVAVDRSRRAYLVGSTGSKDLPLRGAVQPTIGNSSCTETEPKELCDDAFVAGLTGDGRRLRFSTYLGGNAEDQGLGIAVARSGAIFVAGSTDSHAFRTAAPIQPALGGAIDGFASELAPGGRRLVFSTYFGGAKDERFSAVAVDSAGQPVLTGRTQSPNFPVAAPAQPALGGDIDGVVTRLR